VTDYQAYEDACETIRAENAILLTEFVAWLEASGLSEKVVKKHCGNIDFYINDYLLYEDALEAKDGVDGVSWFLGDWFIRKAMWSSQASIKENAASLKKFYAFMHEKGLVSADDLAELKRTVKDEMPDWLDAMRDYNNAGIDDSW
jgi:site-specific recombinase XerD